MERMIKPTTLIHGPSTGRKLNKLPTMNPQPSIFLRRAVAGNATVRPNIVSVRAGAASLSKAVGRCTFLTFFPYPTLGNAHRS